MGRRNWFHVPNPIHIISTDECIFPTRFILVSLEYHTIIVFIIMDIFQWYALHIYIIKPSYPVAQNPHFIHPFYFNESLKCWNVFTMRIHYKTSTRISDAGSTESHEICSKLKKLCINRLVVEDLKWWDILFLSGV